MSQVIYRKSDRLKVRIGKGNESITLFISPLSHHEKMVIQTLIQNGTDNKNPSEVSQGVLQAVRFAVKGVDGVVDASGNPYELTFTDDGQLDESSLDDLLNLPQGALVTYISNGLMGGVPEKFLDEKGQPLPDVELIRPVKSKKKPKTSEV